MGSNDTGFCIGFPYHQTLYQQPLSCLQELLRTDPLKHPSLTCMREALPSPIVLFLMCAGDQEGRSCGPPTHALTRYKCRPSACVRPPPPDGKASHQLNQRPPPGGRAGHQDVSGLLLHMGRQALSKYVTPPPGGRAGHQLELGPSSRWEGRLSARCSQGRALLRKMCSCGGRASGSSNEAVTMSTERTTSPSGGAVYRKKS